MTKKPLHKYILSLYGSNEIEACVEIVWALHMCIVDTVRYDIPTKSSKATLLL